jgi:hypothetical protein
VLLADAPLTFREFMSKEGLPLSTVFREMFTFLTTRSDAVLFGAHAVNAYCEPERMTQDVDLLSTDAAALAEQLRSHLAAKFTIAVRVREVVPGVGFRIYQVQKPKNRHLADVRQVASLPPHETREGILTISPLELVVMKTVSLYERRGKEKGLSDRLDLHRLLHAFPALKADEGAVVARLGELGCSEGVLAAWRGVVGETFEADDDGDDPDDD